MTYRQLKEKTENFVFVASIYILVQSQCKSNTIRLTIHEVPKSQESLIYYENIHEKIVRTFFVDVQNVKYILSDTYFCSYFIKIEN